MGEGGQAAGDAVTALLSAASSVRAFNGGLAKHCRGDRPGTIVLVFQEIALRTLHVDVGSNRDRGTDKDKCRSAGFVVASGPSFESTVKFETFDAMHNLYLSASGSRATNRWRLKCLAWGGFSRGASLARGGLLSPLPHAFGLIHL